MLRIVSVKERSENYVRSLTSLRVARKATSKPPASFAERAKQLVYIYRAKAKFVPGSSVQWLATSEECRAITTTRKGSWNHSSVRRLRSSRRLANAKSTARALFCLEDCTAKFDFG
jgi:hypothetical protein